MDLSSTKDKVLGVAERHPHILLAIVIVLVILLIVMYFNPCGWSLGSLRTNRRKKKCKLDDESEMDMLIDSINEKQRRK
jgi:hypothetical protein